MRLMLKVGMTVTIQSMPSMCMRFEVQVEAEVEWDVLADLAALAKQAPICIS